MRLLLLTGISAALTLTTLANASTITGAGGNFSGSGTLTTVSNGDGSFTITAISGTSAEVGYLLAPGTFHANDNLIYPLATSVVDAQGFSFTDTQADTAFMVDILQDASSSTGYSAYFLDSDNDSGSVDVTLALSSSMSSSSAQFTPNALTTNYTFSFAPAIATTPEPSTLMLLGTGCFASVGMLRRRLARR